MKTKSKALLVIVIISFIIACAMIGSTLLKAQLASDADFAMKRLQSPCWMLGTGLESVEQDQKCQNYIATGKNPDGFYLRSSPYPSKTVEIRPEIQSQLDIFEKNMKWFEVNYKINPQQACDVLADDIAIIDEFSATGWNHSELFKFEYYISEYHYLDARNCS